jgi:hypothetical protein
VNLLGVEGICRQEPRSALDSCGGSPRLAGTRAPGGSGRRALAGCGGHAIGRRGSAPTAACPALAAAALLAAVIARADGLAFDGDVPRFPHSWVELEAAQREALDRGPPAAAQGLPVIQLSARQREALHADGGADAPWLFVLDREAAEERCACGAYNLGVRVGPWLAVYTGALGDYPSPDEVARASRAPSEPALAFAAPAGEPDIRGWHGSTGIVPPRLARARDLLPEARFARFLPAAHGWQAVAVRRPPLADFLTDLDDAALGLTAERQLSAQPTGASSATWPESGARRTEPDGTALYALPYVFQGELGAPSRAWLLLAYRDGLLVEPALVAESGLVAGATYAWEE